MKQEVFFLFNLLFVKFGHRGETQVFLIMESKKKINNK